MIYVYKQEASEGARELVEALDGRRIRYISPTGLRRLEHTRPYRPSLEDLLVAWGESVPNATQASIKVLNGSPQQTKFAQAQRLIEAGVATIEVSQARPNVAPVEQFFEVLAGRRSKADAVALMGQLARFVDAPAVPSAEWVGRRNNHVGGSDLLNPGIADYWAKKEPITDEYRIHCFKGKSIRAGKKAPRPGVAQHPWVRSYDGGWFIDYSDFRSNRAMRDLASRAVAALGLDFGAVDIGKRADRSLIVLEVNRAPGLEGGTVEAYARAMRAFNRGEWDTEVGEGD